MDGQKLWTKDYVCLLLAVFFAAFANSVFIVVFPVYVIDIGGDNALTGLMLSGLTVAGIVTRLIVGPLIDRLGRKKLLVIGSVTFALNTIEYCFVSSIPGLFILRILNGVTQGIFFPVPPAIVADLSPKKRLVDAMSFFGISAGLAAAIGPLIGSQIAQALDYSAMFVFCSILSVISVLFTLIIKDRYIAPERKRQRFRLPKPSSILEFSILLPSMIFFLISMGNSSVNNYLATCGLARGIGDVSLFFLINNMMMIIARLFMGRLTRRYGMKKLIVTGCLLLLASTVVIAYSHSLWPILLSGMVFGIGVSLATQLLQVIVFETVPVERRGIASSTYMLLGDIGVGAGGALWGVISVTSGYTITYMLSAGAILAAGVLYLYYTRLH